MFFAKYGLVAFIGVSLVDLYSDRSLTMMQEAGQPLALTQELAKEAEDFLKNSTTVPDYEKESDEWVLVETKPLSFPIAQGEDNTLTDKRTWIRYHGWSLTLVFKTDRYISIKKGLAVSTYSIWNGQSYSVIAMLYENLLSSEDEKETDKIKHLARTGAKIYGKWYVNQYIYSLENPDSDIRPLDIEFDPRSKLDPVKVKFNFKSLEGDKEFYINIPDKDGNYDSSPRIGI